MSSENENKQQAMDLAVGQIEKKYGKGAIMRLGDPAARSEIQGIPTGSIGIDVASGIGGVPRGRIVEIFGPESSGKTTLTLHVVGNAQRAGGTAAFIDAEHALDPDYARLLGVDTDKLLVAQPDDGEQALEIADVLVRSGAVDVIVIDSVAALVPRAEIAGEMGDTHVGLQARLMSQAMRKLAGVAKRTNCCLIFINQIREKIGVMFGSPETTPGGHALKFYASMRLDIRRIGALKEGDVTIGNRTRVKVVKNKCAPPFKQAEFDILYGEGMSMESDLIELGVLRNVVQKSGSWLAFGDTRIGQGKEAARKFLKENKDVAARLEHDLREACGIGESRAKTLAAAREAASKESAANDAANDAASSAPRTAASPAPKEAAPVRSAEKLAERGADKATPKTTERPADKGSERERGTSPRPSSRPIPSRPLSRAASR